MPNDLDNPLASNKTIAAHVRDSEAGLADAQLRPVDLRSIPREQWDAYLDHHLALPPHLLDAIAGGPVDPQLVPGLEAAVEQFHGITAPYAVTMTMTLQKTGRPWSEAPEAADAMTGFVLDKPLA